MGTSRRDIGRTMAAKGVAAYLTDEDADVYNATEAAVQQDALMAALSLTALAGDAVAELAATRGVQPHQVLRWLTRERPGPTDEASASPSAVQVVYPDSMEESDWATTEARGWIEVTVRWPNGKKAITFYDPVRLAQEVRDAVTGPGYFAESAVVVLPAVTKEAIEDVVARMVLRHFTDAS